MVNTKRGFIGVAIVLLVLILGLPALAAESLNIKIEQTLPDAIYLNDASGEGYYVTITNNGETITSGFEVNIKTPSGFGVLEIVSVDGPGEGDYSHNGNTITINEKLESSQILKINYKLPTTATNIDDFGVEPKIEISVADQSNSESIDHRIKPGVLSVLLKLDENQAMPVYKGDEVHIVAIIENLGEGTLFDTELSLEMDQYELKKVNGEDYTGNGEKNAYTAFIGALEAGDKREYEFTIKVTGHEDFDLTLKGQNKASNNNKEEVSKLPITFAARQPKVLIEIEPQNIEVPFGETANVMITVTNAILEEHDFGYAYEFILDPGFPIGSEVTVKNDNLWDYSDGKFVYIGTDQAIPNNGVGVDLEFIFEPPNYDLTGAELLIFKPYYENDEGQGFASPLFTGSYSIIDHPILQIELIDVNNNTESSRKERIFLGDQIDLTYKLDAGDLEKWDWEDNGTITFVIALPEKGIEFRENGQGKIHSSDIEAVLNSEGNTLTWILSKEVAENFEVTIFTQASEKYVDAGFEYFVTAKALAKADVDADKAKPDYEVTTPHNFLLQSRQDSATFTQTKKLVDASGNETSGNYNLVGTVEHSNSSHQVRYELQYDFDESSSGEWMGSSIEEDLASMQRINLESLNLQYKIGGGNWQDAPVDSIPAVQPEGKLTFTLDFLKDVFEENSASDPGSVKNKQVSFRYTLELDVDAPANYSDFRFVAITTLKLVGVTGEIYEYDDNKALFYQGVYVPYSRVGLSTEVILKNTSSETNTATIGEVISVEIPVIKATNWPVKNLVVTVDLGAGYSYLGNLSYTESLNSNTVRPAYVEPDDNNKLVFKFYEDQDVFFAENSGSLGTIKFDVVKTCNDQDWTIKVDVVGADERSSGDIADHKVTTSSSKAPQIQLEGVLELKANSPAIVTNRDAIKWSIDVTNTGTGVAYHPYLFLKVKEGFAITGATIDGVSLDDGQVDSGIADWAPNYSYALNDSIGVGETVTVEFVSEITSNEEFDYANLVEAMAKKGWENKDQKITLCPLATGYPKYLPKFVEVIPQVNVYNKLPQDDNSVHVSHDGTMQIVIENKGTSDIYNLEIFQELQSSGLKYDLAGSKPTLKIDSATAQEIDHPTVNGNTLTWSTNALGASLSELKVGQTAIIEFQVYASEDFNESDRKITPKVTWKSVSNAIGERPGLNFFVPRERPNITVEMKGKNTAKDDTSFQPKVFAELEDQIIWEVTIQNNGTAIAKNVLLNLEEMIGEHLKIEGVYSNAELTDEITEADHYIAGRGWKIDDIPLSGSKSYYIGTEVTKANKDILDYEISVSWGDLETQVVGGGDRLTTPGNPKAKASLVTQPVMTVSHEITELTTKAGKFQITLIVGDGENKLPAYDVDLEHILGERYQILANTIQFNGASYNDGPTSNVQDALAGTLTWKFTELEAGTYRITFDVRDYGDHLTNIHSFDSDLSVKYVNSNTPSSVGDQGIAIHELKPQPAKVSLAVTKEASKQILDTLDTEVSWDITVKNTGTATAFGNPTATNLVIVDTVGSGFKDIEISDVKFAGETVNDYNEHEYIEYETIDNQFIWTIKELEKDRTFTATITATMAAGGEHFNTLKATEWNLEGPEGTGKIVDEQSTKAYVAGFSVAKNVGLEKEEPAWDLVADAPGEIVTYEIVLNFPLQDTFKNIVVEDELPAGLSYVNDSAKIKINNATEFVELSANGWSFDQDSNNPKKLTWTLEEVLDLTSEAVPYVITLQYQALIQHEDGIESPLKNDVKVSFEVDYGDGDEPVSFAPDKTGSDQVKNDEHLKTSNQDVQFKEPQATITRLYKSPIDNSDWDEVIDEQGEITAYKPVANHRIKHQIIIKNSQVDGKEAAPLYELQLTEKIPADVEVVSEDGNPQFIVKKYEEDGIFTEVNLVNETGESADATYTYGEGLLTINFKNTENGTLQDGEYFVVEFEVQVDSAISAAVKLEHEARVEGYRSQPNDNINGRDYTDKPAQKGIFTTVASKYEKEVLKPEEIAGEWLITPGQVITYEASFTVPAHTTLYNLELTESVDTDLLAFGELKSIAVDANGETAPTWWDSDGLYQPSASNSQIQSLLPDDGVESIKNETDENWKYTLVYTYIVQDQAGVSRDGQKITSSGEFKFKPSADEGVEAHFVGDQESLFTVVEPDVVLIQSVKNTTNSGKEPVAGAILEYTVTLEALNGENYSNAYDLVVNLELDDGVEYQAGSATWETTSLADDSNGDLVWETGKLIEAGDTATFTYQVVVLDSVQPSQELINIASAKWYSLSKDDTSEAQDSDQIRVYETIGDKQASTSIYVADLNELDVKYAHTFGDADYVRIGDIVTYTATISLQKGTTQNILLKHELLDGFEFVENSASATFKDTDVTSLGMVTKVEGEKVYLVIDLGENEQFTNEADDEIVIEYQLLVKKEQHTGQTQTHLSVASLTYDGLTEARKDGEEVNKKTSVTINQPKLSIEISSDIAQGTAVSADEEVVYTVRITNNGEAPSYDLVLETIIPEGMRGGITGITTNSITVNGESVTPPQAVEKDNNFEDNGKSIWNLIGEDYAIDPREDLILVFAVSTDDDLLAGQELEVATQVTKYYSFSVAEDAVPEGLPLDDDIELDAYRQVYSATSSQEWKLVAVKPQTAELTTDTTTSTIGDGVEYELVFPVDEEFHARLQNVGVQLEATDGVEITSVLLEIDDDSKELAPVAGIYTIPEIPAGKEAKLVITTKLTNDKAADPDQYKLNKGDEIDLQANITWSEKLGDGKIKATSSAVVVVEPELQITQDWGFVDEEIDKDEVLPVAGDQVGFTLTAIAETGDIFVTAHNVTVSTQLEPGMTLNTGSAQVTIYDAGNTEIETVDVDITHNSDEGTISFSVPELEPGQKIELYYEATLNEDVAPNQELGSSWKVVWNSQEQGDKEGRSYEEKDQTSINSANTTGIEKTVDLVDVKVGELVTYTIEIDLQRGLTKELQVIDTLPKDMVYFKTLIINGKELVDGEYAANGHGFEYAAIGLNKITVSDVDDAQTITWDLDNVTNRSTRGSSEPFTIVYQAQVKSNVEDNQLINDVELKYAEMGDLELNDTADIVVIQPNLEILEFTAVVGNKVELEPDDKITYELEVENNGNSSAYEVELTINLPQGIIFPEGSTVQVTINDETDPILGLITDGRLLIVVPEIPADQTITLSYEALVAESLPVHGIDKSTVEELKYHSLKEEEVPKGELGDPELSDRKTYIIESSAIGEKTDGFDLKDANLVYGTKEPTTTLKINYPVDSGDVEITLQAYGRELEELKYNGQPVPEEAYDIGRDEDGTFLKDEDGNYLITIKGDYLNSLGEEGLGEKIITFEMDEYSANPEVTITIQQGQANHINSTVTPATDRNLDAGEPQEIIFTFKDAIGTALASEGVSLSADVSGDSIEFSIDGIGWGKSIDALGTFATDGQGQVKIYVKGTIKEHNVSITGTLDDVSITSGVLTIIPAAVDSLEFIQQPSNSAPDLAVYPAIKVRALDEYDNPIPNAKIELGIATPTDNDATLTGGNEREADASGVAVFEDVSLNKVGDYTLKAKSDGKEVISGEFKISYDPYIDYTNFEPGEENEPPKKITNNPTPTIGLDISSDSNIETVTVVIKDKDGNEVLTGEATLTPEGEWTITVPEGEELPDGNYKVIVTVTDKHGNKSPESMGDLTVDTAEPSIKVPDKTTKNMQPTITGSTENVIEGGQLKVVVKDGDKVIFETTTTVDQDGNWSIETPEDITLDDGSYIVEATHTNTAGTSAKGSGTLTIDTVPPTIELDKEKQVTNNQTPIISGTTDEPKGSQVEVKIWKPEDLDEDGNPLEGKEAIYTGTAIVGEDGKWSITVPSDEKVPEGDYIITATITDKAGNKGTTQGDLIIDLTKPEIKVIDQTTNNRTPTITGTTDEPAGSKVIVEIWVPKDLNDDGNPINDSVTSVYEGIAIVDGDGNWELEVTKELEAKEYTVRGTIKDEAGNEAIATGKLNIVLSDNTKVEEKTDKDGAKDPNSPIIELENYDEPKVDEEDPNVPINGEIELPAGTTVEELINHLVPKDEGEDEPDYEQDYQVVDKDGNERNPKDPIEPGDKLIVTAEDGENKGSYELNVISTGDPIITVDLEGIKEGKPGQEITYTATIANEGPRPIDQIEVTTIIPEGTSYVPGSVKIGGNVVPEENVTFNSVTGELKIKVPETIAVDEQVKVDYALKINDLPNAPYAGSIITEEVRVTYRTVLDDVHQTKSKPVETTILAKQGVEITSGSTKSVIPGGEVIFTHSITNQGNAGDSFTIEVLVKDGLDITWYYDLDGTGQYTPADVPLTKVDGKILVGPFSANETQNLLFVVQVPSTQELGTETIEVIVVSEQDQTVQTSSINSLVITEAAPGIKVNGPTEGVYVGEEYKLEIEYTNNGTTPLENGIITITVPKGSEIIDLPKGATYDPETGEVTIPLETLEPGTEGSVTITIKTNEDLEQGPFEHEAKISVGETTLVTGEHEVLLSNKQPSSITIESEHDLIVGDGVSTTMITAHVTDLLGNPVTDGCLVEFTTGAGLFVESGTKTATVKIQDGKASLTLQSPLISDTVPVRIPVTVSAENKDAGKVSAQIDIVFSPGALTGRLMNSETGLPETGILMRLIQDDGVILEAYTDENGYYIFDVPAVGEYYVAIIRYDEDGNEIEIGGSTNVSTIGQNTLNFGPRIIEGRIVDRMTGLGFDTINVQLLNENGRIIARTTTNEKGNYVFKLDLEELEGQSGMANLSMETLASNTDSWTVVAITNLGHEVKRSIKPLKAGDILLNVGLFVESGGLVTDLETGKPIVGAEVSLLHAGGSNAGNKVNLPLLHGINQANPATTDVAGIYRIIAQPGSYILVASAPGYHSLSVKVDASGEIETWLKLRPLGAGDIEVEKVADREFSDHGGEVEYTIEVTNTTEFTIDQVDVEDILPVGVSYVEGSGTQGVLYNRGKLSWNLLNVASGTHELKYKVKVEDTATVGASLVNEVTAQIHGHAVLAEGSASFIVAEWPEIELEITTDKTNAEVGDRVRYEVQATNKTEGSSPMDSEDTWFEVILPEGFVYQSNTSKVNGVEADEPTIADNVLRWNVGDLKLGEELKLTFATTISTNANETDNITQAYVEGKSEQGKYPYRFGPAETRLSLSRTVFGNKATILGTVFIDSNENGIQDPEEPGLAGVEIYFDHGYMVTTDEFGQYSIGNMEPGTRSMTVASWSLPEGYQVAWGSTEKEHASKFISLNPRGLAVENVPLIPRKEDLGSDLSRESKLKIASGLAEVTVQVSPFKVSGFASGYLEADLEDDLELNLRYDSRQHRELSPDPELFPEWNRGDASVVRDLAPSSHPLYLLLTHPEGNLLYGDYNTAWSTSTRYTNYQRKVTGLRGQHEAGLTGYLFAEGRSMHTEDVPARGLAGYYYLKEMQIIQASEQIWLKSMALNSTGELVEVSRELLERGIDYKMNYMLGSVIFTRPIASLDYDLNEVWIEVTYATAGGGDRNWGYGLAWKFDTEQEFQLSMVGGLPSGAGQGVLVGLDGSYKHDKINLSYAGSTNFKEGYALYLGAQVQATDELTVDFSVEHVGGELTKAGQSASLSPGTEAKLAVGYQINEEYSANASTQVRKTEKEGTIFTDELGLAYHPEEDFRGELGLKSTGKRFGFISQARKLSAFGRVSWQAREKLALQAGSELGFPFATDAWKLQFSSAYALNKMITAELGLKTTMADLLRAKGNLVLGLNVTPEGWPDLYGQYRLPSDAGSQEFALGLRHAFTLDDGIRVRVNAEGTLRTKDDDSVSTGYAVGFGVGYEENPKFRPTAQVEFARRDQENKGRISVAVTGYLDEGVSYEAEANWYFGQQASANRDVLKNELRGALAYRDKVTTEHSILAQYLARTYLLGNVGDFAATEKTVHAGALEWGYTINEDLTVTAQAALKTSKEKSDGEASQQARIYLAQVGAEYQLNLDYGVGLFARMLKDNLGGAHSGFAVELSRRINEDLSLVAGYSSLALEDPDLASLVDWPKALYLRLRMKF